MTTPTRASLAPAAALLLLGACESAPPPPPAYGPREVVELDRWEVRSGGRVLGHLLQLRIEDPVHPRVFYRVQNQSGQWVGHVSEQGRFSRRVPFQEDERDLGIYPMAEGLAVLFEVEEPVEIREQEAAEASGTRREDR